MPEPSAGTAPAEDAPVRILVIQHEEGTDARRFGEWLEAAGAEVTVARPDRGEPLPDPAHLTDVADALVVLGGAAGALDDSVSPWFPHVRALLAASGSGAFPSFNICLGGQMLAVATGGAISRREQGQYGALPLTPTADAAADPVFSAQPAEGCSVLFHHDEIHPPEHAVLLVTGTEAPVQAFRVGEMAWGTQYHPESTGEQIAGWFAGSDSTLPAGLTVERVVAQITAREPEIEASGEPVARAFVDYVRARG